MVNLAIAQSGLLPFHCLLFSREPPGMNREIKKKNFLDKLPGRIVKKKEESFLFQHYYFLLYSII